MFRFELYGKRRADGSHVHTLSLDHERASRVFCDREMGFPRHESHSPYFWFKYGFNFCTRSEFDDRPI